MKKKLHLRNVVRKPVHTLVGLAPLPTWDILDNPDEWLERNSGKWAKGLELALEKAIERDDLYLIRMLLLDLLKMTRIGKARAEVTLHSGVNKLRAEQDFSKLETDRIMEMLGKTTPN